MDESEYTSESSFFLVSLQPNANYGLLLILVINELSAQILVS